MKKEPEIEVVVEYTEGYRQRYTAAWLKWYGIAEERRRREAGLSRFPDQPPGRSERRL